KGHVARVEGEQRDDAAAGRQRRQRRRLEHGADAETPADAQPRARKTPKACQPRPVLSLLSRKAWSKAAIAQTDALETPRRWSRSLTNRSPRRRTTIL